jgi:hypothetical protein
MGITSPTESNTNQLEDEILNEMIEEDAASSRKKERIEFTCRTSKKPSKLRTVYYKRYYSH